MTYTKSGGLDGVKSERFVYSSGLKMNELWGKEKASPLTPGNPQRSTNHGQVT